ncbi:mRNA 3' end processing factor [Coemansia sp. RSA 1365]|nr:mRNA 3' end processing factor [Coemansia sp. RSA 1365]
MSSANGNGASSGIDRELYREFRKELTKLTFNSKPIINDLSKRAEINVNSAETIIKAIEEHLRFTAPKHKLPAFYLLDSIAKNVGGMYISLLHGRIDKIFIDIWRSVEDEVKTKLERTLGTWRHGFIGGQRNLFPEFVLRKIEEDVNRLKAKAKESTQMMPEASGDDLLDNLTGLQSHAKKRAREEQQQSIQRAVTAKADSYNSAAHRDRRHPDKRQRTPDRAKEGHNSQQGLLQLVNSILVKKQVEVMRRPNDVKLFTVLNMLKDIKATVAESELPPERVREIREQLSEIDGTQSNGGGRRAAHKSDTTTPPYMPPPLSPDMSSGAHQQQHHANGNSKSVNDGNATDPTLVVTEAMSSLNNTTGGMVDAGQLLQGIMARPEVLNSLRKVAPVLSSSLESMTIPQHHEGAGYKDFAQLDPIPLSHASISRVRPGIYNILYAGYGNQCSQCGWRTKDHDTDQMKKHLDWHFRRNMRQQNDRERRAPPRGWYMDQSQWEAGATAEDTQPPTGAAAPAVDGQGDKDNLKSIAELKQMTVAAPPNHNDSCAICKEAFERRFNEEEEDWVLVNAVLVDGTVFHATCHAGSH